jgi:hypothetical protein
VGLRRARALLDTAERLRAGTRAAAPHNIPVGSPWAPGDLHRIVTADIFGLTELPITREVAIGIPAVARARHLLVGAIAQLPLRAVDANNALLPEQPSWLSRTDDGISPWHRMAWSIDDVFFGGWSLWVGDYGARDVLLNATRIPPADWSFDADGTVLIGNEPPADPETLILIPGPGEGLLIQAHATIRAAIDQEVYWQHRARTPIPVTELHQTIDDQITPEEVREMLAAYAAARRDPDGALTWTPFNVELRVHGEGSTDLLIEARNAVAVDIASHTGLPAAALNASLSTATLTYSTQETAQGEVSSAARLYSQPIEGRLSQDDVVPRGTRVAFDYGNTFAPAPYGPTRED